MRDIDRIDPLLSKLGKAWKVTSPDLRFGQFFHNLTKYYAREEVRRSDPFYWEDYLIDEALNNMLERVLETNCCANCANACGYGGLDGFKCYIRGPRRAEIYNCEDFEEL